MLTEHEPWSSCLFLSSDAQRKDMNTTGPHQQETRSSLKSFKRNQREFFFYIITVCEAIVARWLCSFWSLDLNRPVADDRFPGKHNSTVCGLLKWRRTCCSSPAPPLGYCPTRQARQKTPSPGKCVSVPSQFTIRNGSVLDPDLLSILFCLG